MIDLIKRLVFGDNATTLGEQLRNGESIAKSLDRALRKRIRAGDHERTLMLGEADRFFDDVLEIENENRTTTDLPDGMTPYISASVAAVLHMLDTVRLSEGAVLCDVGAGLFRIPILAHLLSGLPTMGVELDKKLIRSAEEILERNNISGVQVLSGDARKADLKRATVFSFNLPFDEEKLAPFLRNIRPGSGEEQITIYPFCWHYVFWDVEWLEPRKLPWVNEAGEAQYYFKSSRT